MLRVNAMRILKAECSYKAAKMFVCVVHMIALSVVSYPSALAKEVDKELHGLERASGDGTVLLIAQRIFDGVNLRSEQAVLVNGSAIVDVGASETLKARARRVINFGDATILPGFIELHAHAVLRNVPQEVVLKHGVTTLRDVGGPLLRASGGVGKLRVLTSGPIITVQDGYPISVFGKGYIAEVVRSPDEARALVSKLVEGASAVIKIALEPGGEPGAPWSQQHPGTVPPPWPIASGEIISAIVMEAHRLGQNLYSTYRGKPWRVNCVVCGR